MSQFEFVTILYSLVVAFGVSEILAALGRILRDRARVPPFPPQVFALLLLLLALLQSLWGYWGFSDVEWSFWRFLVAFLPLLALSIATSIAIPEESQSGNDSRKEQYFSTTGLVLPLIAVWVLLGTVAEFTLSDFTWHAGQLVRFGAVVILFALSRSRSPRAHSIGLLVLGALQLAFVEVVTPALN